MLTSSPGAISRTNLAPDDVQRGRLARDDPAAVQPAEHQRPETMRVAGRVQRLLIHEDERISALGQRQYRRRRVLDLAGPVDGFRARADPGQLGAVGDEQRREHVGVGRRADPVAARHGAVEQGGQLTGVDQVSVMPEGQAGLAGGTEGRLRVGPDRGAGGGVPAVSHRDVPAQRGQGGFVEDLGDQSHFLVDHDAAAVADGYARGLLPAVLQRVEPEVSELGDVFVGRPDTEDAAGVSWRPVLG